jgi:hypothetical protein
MVILRIVRALSATCSTDWRFSFLMLALDSRNRARTVPIYTFRQFNKISFKWHKAQKLPILPASSNSSSKSQQSVLRILFDRLPHSRWINHLGNYKILWKFEHHFRFLFVVTPFETFVFFSGSFVFLEFRDAFFPSLSLSQSAAVTPLWCLVSATQHIYRLLIATVP